MNALYVVLRAHVDKESGAANNSPFQLLNYVHAFAEPNRSQLNINNNVATIRYTI